MVPILYESDEQSFSTMGLGAMNDCLSCTVTEERNGEYELEMTYPATGVRFADLELNNIILAKPNYTDQEQPFRIYKITKPLSGIITVCARHISYDLSGYPLASGSAVSGLANTLNYLNNNSIVSGNPFTIAADFSSNLGTFTPNPIRSIRQWLGGVDGSLLDIWGGEWHFDRFTATLCSARGEDRGVQILYGKNLTSLTQEETSDKLYSGVIPYYLDESGNYVEGAEQSTGATLDPERILTLDCTDKYEDIPTAAQLNSYAASYITSAGLASPKVNLELGIVQLDQVTDRVDLCDTVTVYFEKFGISASAKCIKTVWDVLLDRYDAVTIGDARTTLADTISSLESSSGSGEAPLSVLESDLSSAATMAASTWVTHADNSNMPSLTLTTGTWILEGKGVFSSNATGTRILGMDSSDSHSTIDIRAAAATSGTTQTVYSKLIKVTNSSTTFYLSAWQDSGATLTLNTGTYMKAVRIGG